MRHFGAAAEWSSLRIWYTVAISPQEAFTAFTDEMDRQHGYRAYEAEDLEGYRWTFAQARPTM
jgi:hypothetical protein